MKHSQTIGIVATLALIISCFLPWIEVTSINKTFSGIHGVVNADLSFGRQLIPHSFFAIFLIIFFSIPKIWAKRTNIFFGLINFGWAIKNYIIFSLCRQGECPKIKLGLYLVVLFSSVIQVMVLTPKLEIPQRVD